MEKEYSSGQMVVNIKAILSMIKKMDLVSFNGVMGEFMKDILQTVCKMVKENIRIKISNGFQGSGIKVN